MQRIEQAVLADWQTEQDQKLQKEAERKRLEQEKADYAKKLERYQQEFSQAVEAEYPLNQFTLTAIQAFQQQLGLKSEDIDSVEQPIREAAEVAYQQKLRQQEKVEQQQQLQQGQAATAQQTVQKDIGISGLGSGEPELQLKTFEFEVVTLNTQAQVEKRKRQQASYFSENLGDNIWLDMVAIPGGNFSMGSPDGEEYDTEKPQHQVTVKPFFMGKFPVTQAQWRAVASMPKINQELNLDPSHFKDDMRPVEQVSWHDANEFCERLFRFTGRQYRLPSEAEWEYACRAGTNTPFYFGSAISRDFVNCKRNFGMALVSLPLSLAGTGGGTTEVGVFQPNAFGLYDLHGNVWEWCLDDWHDSYKNAPTDGSPWQVSDNNCKVVRGGSWVSFPRLCRSAVRPYNTPGNRNFIIGFRVVCSAPRT